jgi:hypothetical protein
MANATQVILTVTAAMKLGAQMRALPIAAYVAQLADADAASIRSLKVQSPLTSTSRCEVSHEELRTNNDNWSPRMRGDKRKQILALLDEGLAPRVIAQRCGVSDPTIYRIRGEAEKKAAQPQTRRLAESVIDELCAAYANGEPVAKLVLRFGRTPNVLYGELRKRGVAIQRIGRKAEPAQCLAASPMRCYRHVTVEQVREAIAAVEGGETWKSVAKKMGLSRESLRRNARRLGAKHET